MRSLNVSCFSLYTFIGQLLLLYLIIDLDMRSLNVCSLSQKHLLICSNSIIVFDNGSGYEITECL